MTFPFPPRICLGIGLGVGCSKVKVFVIAKGEQRGKIIMPAVNLLPLSCKCTFIALHCDTWDGPCKYFS